MLSITKATRILNLITQNQYKIMQEQIILFCNHLYSTFYPFIRSIVHLMFR